MRELSVALFTLFWSYGKPTKNAHCYVEKHIWLRGFESPALHAQIQLADSAPVNDNEVLALSVERTKRVPLLYASTRRSESANPEATEDGI